MFRVRECMRAGEGCPDAIVTSVGRVGETITFSAGVLIAALGSLAVATFSLYSGLAAPLSIGIGLIPRPVTPCSPRTSRRPRSTPR
jgi:uncharacterized membrane protein YdfJ with MMPL/SSD domain